MKAKWLLALSLGALLAFSSCNKDDDGPSSPLEQSKWELTGVDLQAGAKVVLSNRNDDHGPSRLIYFERSDREVAGSSDKYEGYSGAYKAFDMGHKKIYLVFSDYYDNVGSYVLQYKSKEGEDWGDYKYSELQYATKGDYIYKINRGDVELWGKMEKKDDVLTIESVGKEDFEEAHKNLEEVIEEYISNQGEAQYREEQVLKVRKQLFLFKTDMKFKENQDKAAWKLTFKKAELKK